LGGLLGSKLASDETVIFFPSYAVQSPDLKTWRVKVHAWVFELEASSRLRGRLLQSFASRLEATESEVSSRLFQERAKYFLVDNERGKEIALSIGGERFVFGPSEANGHLQGVFTLDDAVVSKLRVQDPHRGISFIQAVVDTASDRGALSPVQISLLDANGISVVSDLDDTIKISEVSSKRALIKNTFLGEYAPVPGMSEIYRKWSSPSVSFHYVTASPWQLYPSMIDFFDRQGFPHGTISMKVFRWKDSSFFDLFASNDGYKRPLVEEFLSVLPKRAFYFVGDSGEKDIELYCGLAKAYPEQVKGIFIRKTPGIALTPRSFGGSCARLITFFDSAQELPVRLP
jgi:phosphatidate phosphatase APP1